MCLFFFFLKDKGGGPLFLEKLKIIRAIETSLLGSRTRNRDPVLSYRRGRQDVIEAGETKADVFDVARFAPDVHAVDVDVSQRFLERIKRMFGIPFRA